MNCARCGKRISFVRMANGKSMPVDEKPVYVIPKASGPVRAFSVTGRQFNAVYGKAGQCGVVKAYVSHWPNCNRDEKPKQRPTQAEWRRRKEERRDVRLTQTHINHPHRSPVEKDQKERGYVQQTLF